MNKDAYDAYEYTTISLRELMVPINTTWAKQFSRLESNSNCSYEMIPSPVENMKGMYTTPYPYKTSFWAEYMMSKYGTCSHPVTPADRAAIRMGVQQRLDLALITAISDENIALIDNNFDYGCVVYSRSGVIVPFEYSKVTSIQFISTPGILQFQLELRKPDLPEYKREELTKAMKDAEEYAKLCYTFEYNNDKGDVFYPAGKIFEAFPGRLTRLENVDSTIEYMQVAFTAHTKCMILA